MSRLVEARGRGQVQSSTGTGRGQRPRPGPVHVLVLVEARGRGQYSDSVLVLVDREQILGLVSDSSSSLFYGPPYKAKGLPLVDVLDVIRDKSETSRDESYNIDEQGRAEGESGQVQY